MQVAEAADELHILGHVARLRPQVVAKSKMQSLGVWKEKQSTKS